jgi:hypothetical protein
MNARRGYARLSAAVLASWAIGWAMVGAYAAWQQGVWSDIFIKASRSSRLAEMSYANEHAQKYANLLTTCLFYGMLTLPLSIALALGWWLYLGSASQTRSTS